MKYQTKKEDYTSFVKNDNKRSQKKLLGFVEKK